jgi:hypothetical protein
VSSALISLSEGHPGDECRAFTGLTLDLQVAAGPGQPFPHRVQPDRMATAGPGYVKRR